ncbi:MAG: VCBS repeat-containing protein, partial [Candidatus Latescibacterota bacterium]
MRHRFALPVALLFSLALLVASRALAEEAKPVPEVALVPSAPAGALSPAEAEKLRLLEAGLLSPVLATQAARPVPAASGGAPEMSSDGRDIICYYQLMTSGLVDTVPPPSPPSYFYHHYQQPVSYWSAVGVRSAPGDDWDIELYAGVGAVPPCVDTLIGYSNRSSGVDFVVGDFNHVGASEDYVACSRYSGLSDGLIEWDDGADVLVTNAPPIGRSTGPTDILEVWDIYLETGKNYSFLFESTGSADMKLLLFRNTGSGAFYLGRNGAEWEQPAGGTALYSPGSSDWYGLVVVNDNGERGTYTLEAGTCLAPVALSSAASVATPAANGHYSCDQSYAYWSAVGVRGDDPAADWDVSLYSIGSGASWPTCFTGGAGLSADFPGQVDFVARDFNAGHNPFGYFYAHAHRTAGAGQARTEWDDGGDLLALDVPAYRSTGPNDVLETWDVYVEKNVDYNVYLERSGADVGVVVIPPIAYGYWGNRHDGLVDSDEPCAHFLAGDSAYYAVVAVNDDGGSGDYGLAVGEQFVDQAVPPFEDTLDSRGISAADFDDDGDLDLYLTVAGAPDKLFRNDGTGYFTEVLPSPFVHSGFETGAVWGDYDNDGDLDVFVVVNAYGSCRLYRNDGGNFTDVTQAPLDHAGTGQSASWSDYDRDGFLDLFVAYGGGDRLYHNERGGTFSIATPGALQYGEGRDGAWGDYDNDGDPDLYVAKSALSASQLLRNDDGTFVDATPGALGTVYQGIASASWVDYDNDQDLDLFVADEDGDHLFRSDGGGAFTNVSAAPIADSTMSLAHVWTDYDNDSDLDLFLPDMTGPARLIRNLWAEGFDGSFVSGLGA